MNKQLIIKIGDFVLTEDRNLFEVIEIRTDCVIVTDGTEVAATDIIDVKK
ncbi:MAG: hypothetical protein ACOCRX_09875 [Candidatus Woesearchaeota archaeon]